MLRNKGEFIRFVMVGGVNTANYYVIYLLFFRIAGVSYLFSHWIAFFISMVISFYLNVYFTYRVKPTLKKFLQFPITQVVNMSISSVFIYIFVEYLHLNGYIAPILAVVFTVPVTFILTSKILKRGNQSL
ncbi:GtrA family protein [Pseudalkalibacillus caeni]|uniref:GtrA family protein n=1 Tax=Exobacillus caeni TaxID=2574798 RepID=A0A5R9F626_9BACL|nr:GtrA family protein [Pseudalkalibacillus caeni]TLS36273.1 GtrA family protein [Pseudalkalibacillus caeni]